jgi:hypothetical protein
MTVTLNGAPRKKLSDQIDRLDTLLDGLADAIPEVVADAIRASVREAVHEAVHIALAELLAHPALSQAFAAPVSPPQPVIRSAPPPVSPPAPPRPPAVPPSVLTRVSRGIWQGVSWAGQQLGRIGRGAVQVVTTVARAAGTVIGMLVRPAPLSALGTLAAVALTRRPLPVWLPYF